MSKNELLSLFMDEERVFMLENTALNDSFDYFVDKMLVVEIREILLWLKKLEFLLAVAMPQE
mgnify:CR=1 FL=1